jgi:alkylation response protein AidB-like acyl-CoA dehydrogenase
VDFDYTPEQQLLRDSVAALGKRYGHEYFVRKAKSGEHSTELWDEAAKLGYLGVSVPESYGGGGGGITELAVVCEELAAAGCPLLLLVVSPAIVATIIAKHGTDDQRKRFLPGLADGSRRIAFAITEPEAGSNFHRLGTVARRDGDGWVLDGRKCFISGVDNAHHVLVVARTEDARTGKLQPALFLVPADAPGLTRSRLDMEIVSPEHQFLLYLDDVRLPADALVGGSPPATC